MLGRYYIKLQSCIGRQKYQTLKLFTGKSNLLGGAEVCEADEAAVGSSARPRNCIALKSVYLCQAMKLAGQGVLSGLDELLNFELDHASCQTTPTDEIFQKTHCII
ncbi:hypothetical protein B0H14DRAFT_2585426 [Mycena olivaceomarginata]|nr:hypothetical protein B0H14DRAFT_2585426 [Mycena olivaceomarginata]